jgi:hypothetical protein
VLAPASPIRANWILSPNECSSTVVVAIGTGLQPSECPLLWATAEYLTPSLSKVRATMSRAPAIFRSVAFLIAFCCCAVPARAEPIRVTSGFVFAGFDRLGAPLNAEDLRISGAGFRIGSSLEDEEAFVQRALHL